MQTGIIKHVVLTIVL